MEKIILSRDVVIPKGTVFENCDGQITEYVDGNFVASMANGKDGIISVYVDEHVNDISILNTSAESLKTERPLSCPITHDLIDIFYELKFGRPSEDQKFLQKCINELTESGA